MNVDILSRVVFLGVDALRKYKSLTGEVPSENAVRKGKHCLIGLQSFFFMCQMAVCIYNILQEKSVGKAFLQLQANSRIMQFVWKRIGPTLPPPIRDGL